MDVGLFDRKKRPPVLTAEGERLLPYARDLLLDASRLSEIVGDPSKTPTYELTIGTRYELGLSWLTPALSYLSEGSSDRTLHLCFGASAFLLNLLRQCRVDAIITSVRLTESGLSYAALHPETYVLVGPPNTRFRRPEDASAHTLIDIDRSLPLFRYLLDARDDAAPWPFKQGLWMGTIAAIRHRLLEGIGVAVLPEYFVRGDIEAGRLERLLPKHPMHTDAFRLIWREGDPREPALLKLAEELRELPLQ